MIQEYFQDKILLYQQKEKLEQINQAKYPINRGKKKQKVEVNNKWSKDDRLNQQGTTIKKVRVCILPTGLMGGDTKF